MRKHDQVCPLPSEKDIPVLSCCDEQPACRHLRREGQPFETRCNARG